MPRGNFIAAPTFNSTFFGLHLTCLALFCAAEVINTLLAMKKKLTKEEKRHLDNARRDKQAKEHAMQQAQELPPVRSSSPPHKLGLSHRLSPLRLFCPTPRDIVYALESLTKSNLLDRTLTPAHPARVSGVQPPTGLGGLGSGPLGLPPTKKHRAPLRSPSTLGSSSQPFVVRKGLFFSTEQAGKITMTNEMAQLWGLPPYVTPEGTPTSLEEAPVHLWRYTLYSLQTLLLLTLAFGLTCDFLDRRVLRFACPLDA